MLWSVYLLLLCILRIGVVGRTGFVRVTVLNRSVDSRIIVWSQMQSGTRHIPDRKDDFENGV